MADAPRQPEQASEECIAGSSFTAQAQANTEALASIQDDLDRGHLLHAPLAVARDYDPENAPVDSSLQLAPSVASTNTLLQSTAQGGSLKDRMATPDRFASPDLDTARDPLFQAHRAAVSPTTLSSFQELIRATRNSDMNTADRAQATSSAHATLQGDLEESASPADSPLALWRAGETPQLVMSRETSLADSDAPSATSSAGGGTTASAAAGTHQRSLAQQLAGRLAAGASPKFERERVKRPRVVQQQQPSSSSSMAADDATPFTEDQKAAMHTFDEDEADYFAPGELASRAASLDAAAARLSTQEPDTQAPSSRIGDFKQVDSEIFDIMARAGFPLPADIQSVLLHGSADHSTETLKESSLQKPQDDEPSESDEDEAPITGYGGGHGVRKTILDPAALAAKQARDAQKAQTYKMLMDAVNLMREAGDYSREAFDKTLALLRMNPEYYTIWNYRRTIFLQGLFPACQDDSQAKQDLIVTELKLLQAILQDYPKVYCLWVHRKWCLSNCPWPDLQRELGLVTRMLEQDARNFHVWEYRRYVVSQLEEAQAFSLAEREFEYTTAAISSNFSNFSAWHNRTKLIPALLKQKGEDEVALDERREEMLETELNLLRDALFTDPDDQSVWLYHRWLLNPDSGPVEQFPLAPRTSAARQALLRQEIKMVDALLEEEPGHVWCLDARCIYNLALFNMANDNAERKALLQMLEEDVSLLQVKSAGTHQRYASLLEKARQQYATSQGPSQEAAQDVSLDVYQDVGKKLGKTLEMREIVHAKGQAFVLAKAQGSPARIILPMTATEAKQLDLPAVMDKFDAVRATLSTRANVDAATAEQLVGVVDSNAVRYIACQFMNVWQ